MDKKRSPLHQMLLDKNKEKTNTSALFDTQANVAAKGEEVVKFNAQQGHGFAAEQANNLIDTIYGKNATIVGNDNAKNGADRLVDGQFIQTKYCSTARESINAAFDHDGNYRYIDSNENPMQLEIPKDQYNEAVEYMRKKIEAGKVKGVTDPNEAENLVRKGNVTYRQAMQIAKAGNIESITFDAANGTVIGMSALGISATIIFARELWSGENFQGALDKALYAGLQAGGVAFLTSVLTAQLMRTSMPSLLIPSSIQMVKLLPSQVRHLLVNALREGASIYGGAATQNLAKLLRSNIISATVLTVIITGPQVVDYFRGRISGPQLFKTVTTTVSSIGGGALGAMLGSLVGPIGTFVGGIISGAIAGTSVSSILDNFFEDDAIKMVRILEQEFVPLAEYYILSQEEVELILDALKMELGKGVLLAMHASDNHHEFAQQLLKKLIEDIISYRVRVYVPEGMDIINRMVGLVGLIEAGNDLSYLVQRKQIDPQAIARKLLNKDIPAEVARKAWYVTKQTQCIMMQTEYILEHGKSKELSYKQTIENIRNERAYLKKILLEDFS